MKHRRHHSSLPGERTGIISRLETQQGTTATHWRAKDRHYQWAKNTAMHHSHSQTREAKTGTISRLETQQGTTATYNLWSRATTVTSVDLKNIIKSCTHNLIDWPFSINKHQSSVEAL
jgi:hypothetical protein